MISEKLMKRKRVMGMPLNSQDAPELEPTLASVSEAAAILIQVFEEEQQRLKEGSQSKEARIIELEGKIQALKRHVTPIVSTEKASAGPSITATSDG
ncbi:hypothetical protein LIER_23124 [Lithospermum erythrorhizon]|uniref:Uncharacterized protein n=1 Tax=Lithospermum erythrorhizon TaxID=34254 RepID=A0AAV3QXK0_LITER